MEETISWREWVKKQLENQVPPEWHQEAINAITVHCYKQLEKHGFVKKTAQKWTEEQFEQEFGPSLRGHLQSYKPGRF